MFKNKITNNIKIENNIQKINKIKKKMFILIILKITQNKGWTNYKVIIIKLYYPKYSKQ